MEAVKENRKNVEVKRQKEEYPERISEAQKRSVGERKEARLGKELEQEEKRARIT